MTANQFAARLSRIITQPDKLPMLWPGNSEGDSPLSVVTLDKTQIADWTPERRKERKNAYLRPNWLIWDVRRQLIGPDEEQVVINKLMMAFWGTPGSRVFYRRTSPATQDLYLLTPFSHVWVGVKIANIVNTSDTPG